MFLSVRSRPWRRGALAVSAALAATVAVGLIVSAATPAAAALPVSNSFTAYFPGAFGAPTQSPPGANNFACRPSAAHPFPVVLVHGTFENMNDNWGGVSPLLANNGFCVFAFNFGGASPTDSIQGTGPIAASAGQLATFVDQVRAATGASKVDIVGHSQGGMMPRYFIKNLGGASKVDKLVGLSPSNHGTTLDGLTELGQALGISAAVDSLLASGGCQACVDQEVGSAFLTALNAGGDTVAGVSYTVITTNGDEVVTPFTSAELASGPNVTNIVVQDQCALDGTEHLEIAFDPIALTDVLNALDPAHPRPINCVVVLPLVGPIGS